MAESHLWRSCCRHLRPNSAWWSCPRRALPRNEWGVSLHFRCIFPRNPLWLAHWPNANQLPFWAFYGFSMAFLCFLHVHLATGTRGLGWGPHLLHLPLPAAPSVPLHTLAPQHAGRLARWSREGESLGLPQPGSSTQPWFLLNCTQATETSPHHRCHHRFAVPPLSPRHPPKPCWSGSLA